MIRGVTQRVRTIGGDSRLGLTLAAGLALLTGVLIFVALRANDSTASTRPGTGSAATAVTVVTAQQNIPAGIMITPDMVGVVSVAPDAVLSDVARDPQLVVGRVARIPILQGEQLVAAKLTAVGALGTGLSYIVPDGYRAMAVKVDKVVGAGGLLRPGDRVDVFAVITRDSGTQAVAIAQYVQVLAVEQDLQVVLPPAEPGEDVAVNADGTLVDQPSPQPASTVATLALPPAEALRVFYAESAGAIRLAVRAPGDDFILPASAPSLLEGFEDTAVNAQTSLSYVVPEGHRAMAVTVDKVVSAGGLIRPGDHVDLLAVLEVDTIGDSTTLTFARSITVAQNIEVLAVEQALENQTDNTANSEAAEQPAVQPNAIVVTLALTPLQAQHVLLAELQGTIRLSVRPPGDTTLIDIPDSAFFSIANSTNPLELITDSERSVYSSGD